MMIPSTVARTLTLPQFTEATFTATQWSSPSDKAKFAKHLLRFIAEGYPRNLFTKAFYRRLSNSFGHIAHYSQWGFWEYYFAEDVPKVMFLSDTAGGPTYGDPAFTFSDVERVVKARIVHSGVIDWYRREDARRHETKERALLETLQRKYGAGATNPAKAIPVTTPLIQTDLFGKK